MMKTGHATILVDVLDQDEMETGQTVPVDLRYVEEIDSEYGADADGNRGTLLIERLVIDKFIAPEHIQHLSSWQVERLLADDEVIFYQR